MTQSNIETRPPYPPFSEDTAILKVQAAEDAWNTKNAKLISKAYTKDTSWRNRSVFVNGRDQGQAFLENKWEKKLDYKLKKELWSFSDNRIAVKFYYEWHDLNDQWFRSYGNELWEFAENGLMQRREASINDMQIEVSDRILKN